MRYLALILITALLCCKAYGQAIEKNEEQTGELYLKVKNVNFIKDNEYFNQIGENNFTITSSIPVFADKSKWIEGYTLSGFFFQPELVYKASPKVILSGGISMLSYSGTDKFSQVRPVISTSMNLTENTVLTLGTLSGSEKHGMFDPHFNSERLYTAYHEDGIQVTHSDDHFFNDTWVSWENFIFKGDSTREIFTFGESFRYKSVPLAHDFQIEIPIQLQFKHFGGQISNYPQPMQTFFNFSAGLKVNYDIADKRLGQFGIEYLWFLNSVIPNHAYYAVTKGNAGWLRFHYNYKVLYLGAAFWKAHDFYAPNGNSIYASIYDFNSDYAIHNRSIITNYICLTLYPQKNLELLFGLETYYNRCIKKMDYAITLHLNFEKMFKIATIKN